MYKYKKYLLQIKANFPLNKYKYLAHFFLVMATIMYFSAIYFGHIKVYDRACYYMMMAFISYYIYTDSIKRHQDLQIEDSRSRMMKILDRIL